MTWTYDNAPGTSSAASRRDTVRFLVGDTDSTDKLVSDEEISYSLDFHSDNTRMAAAHVADAISGKFARKVRKQVGDLTIDWNVISKHYSELATRLRNEVTSFSPSPYAGGISISDKTSIEGDSDRPEPFFYRSLHQYGLETTSTST